MIDSQTAQQRAAAAIKTFPATFQLRAFPGETFRIGASSSYVNDSGTLMLYTEIQKDGKWLSFAKGTISELQKEIVAPPQPRTFALTVTGEAEAIIVSTELTRRSMWFQLLPLPDDQWEFAVKAENEIELGRIARPLQRQLGRKVYRHQRRGRGRSRGTQACRRSP